MTVTVTAVIFVPLVTIPKNLEKLLENKRIMQEVKV